MNKSRVFSLVLSLKEEEIFRLFVVAKEVVKDILKSLYFRVFGCIILQSKEYYLSRLKLKPAAIGSLPHKNSNSAIEYVFDLFREIPFWPQLAGVNRFEDMIFQYTQNVPGVRYDKENIKYYFDQNAESFFDELENFYIDYDSIVNENDSKLLAKYAISSPHSGTVELFFEKIAKTTPPFGKGHIVGPFTWGTGLCDEEGKCAFFDDTLRDIVIKSLTLKALWQIEQIKQASKDTKPIIFLDEPAISQCGTSAFITVQKEDVINSIKEISDIIQGKGAMSAIHCCGKADWDMILETNVNIINFDAYSFAQSLSLYHSKINKFLESGGYIAWGVIPTLDKAALEEIDLDIAVEKFEKAVSFLTQKGLDKDLIIRQSIITPSCGAGSLSKELADKAMRLTISLSDELLKRY